MLQRILMSNQKNYLYVDDQQSTQKQHRYSSHRIHRCGYPGNRKFYTKIFGAPDRADGAKILYTVGPTLLIFMQKSTPTTVPFERGIIDIDTPGHYDNLQKLSD